MKGLAVQPGDRFQSAAEFLDAIENQLAVEVLSAAAALALVVGLGIFGRGGGGGSGEGDDRGERLLKAEVPSITILGQEYGTDLMKLDLQGQGLTDADVQDLKYMVNLRFPLQLDDNQLTRLPNLSGLTRLENLQVQNNSLTDTSGVAGSTLCAISVRAGTPVSATSAP